MKFVFFRNSPLIYRRLGQCLTKRYSVRALFIVLFIRPLGFFFEVFLNRIVKEVLIEGFCVSGTARLTLTLSRFLSAMNTGSLRVSLLWIVVGLFFVVGALALT